MKGLVLFYPNASDKEIEDYKIKLKGMNDYLNSGGTIRTSSEIQEYFRLYNTIFNEREPLIEGSCHSCIKKMSNKIHAMSLKVIDDKPIEVRTDAKKKTSK